MYNKGKIAKPWPEYFFEIILEELHLDCWKIVLWSLVWFERCCFFSPAEVKCQCFLQPLKLRMSLSYKGHWSTWAVTGSWSVNVLKPRNWQCSSVAWKLRDSKKREKCIMNDHWHPDWHQSIVSQTDVLRALSCLPVPYTSAEMSGLRSPLWFQQMFLGQERMTKALLMSAWEANQSHDKNRLHPHQKCIFLLRMAETWAKLFKPGLR